MLQAIIYAVYRCGFCPKTALTRDDSSESRLDKIMHFIEDCKYGIHDISRTEINNNGLPRFNMPFELGLFFGAKRFGTNGQKHESALVLERKKYSYMEYLSDLSGVDTKAHNNNPEIVIRHVRDWLSTASKRTEIPGHRIIEKEYIRFKKSLPRFAHEVGLDVNDITFNDFCRIVEWFVRETNLQQTKLT